MLLNVGLIKLTLPANEDYTCEQSRVCFPRKWLLLLLLTLTRFSRLLYNQRNIFISHFHCLRCRNKHILCLFFLTMFLIHIILKETFITYILHVSAVEINIFYVCYC